VKQSEKNNTIEIYIYIYIYILKKVKLKKLYDRCFEKEKLFNYFKINISYLIIYFIK